MSYYKTAIPKEQHHLLKASEMRDIDTNAGRYSNHAIMCMVFAFFTLMSVVSILLWGTKIAIFFSILFFVPSILLLMTSISTYKEFRKHLEEVKERISKEEQ